MAASIYYGGKLIAGLVVVVIAILAGTLIAGGLIAGGIVKGIAAGVRWVRVRSEL